METATIKHKRFLVHWPQNVPDPTDVIICHPDDFDREVAGVAKHLAERWNLPHPPEPIEVFAS